MTGGVTRDLKPAEKRKSKARGELGSSACHEELDSLRKREVFELVDLPKGRKTVCNRWVFNIKSDGRKKA